MLTKKEINIYRTNYSFDWIDKNRVDYSNSLINGAVCAINHILDEYEKLAANGHGGKDKQRR